MSQHFYLISNSYLQVFVEECELQINVSIGLQNGNKIFHEVPNLKVSFPPLFIPPLLYCTENTTILQMHFKVF